MENSEGNNSIQTMRSETELSLSVGFCLLDSVIVVMLRVMGKIILSNCIIQMTYLKFFELLILTIGRQILSASIISGTNL